jgi:hypothetical protein
MAKLYAKSTLKNKLIQPKPETIKRILAYSKTTHFYQINDKLVEVSSN